MLAACCHAADHPSPGEVDDRCALRVVRRVLPARKSRQRRAGRAEDHAGGARCRRCPAVPRPRSLSDRAPRRRPAGVCRRRRRRTSPAIGAARGAPSPCFAAVSAGGTPQRVGAGRCLVRPRSGAVPSATLPAGDQRPAGGRGGATGSVCRRPSRAATCSDVGQDHPYACAAALAAADLQRSAETQDAFAHSEQTKAGVRSVHLHAHAIVADHQAQQLAPR